MDTEYFGELRLKIKMQQKLLDRILRSKWNGKGTHHSGDVLNRLETDVTNVVNFLTEVIPNSLSTLALFVGAFGYLFMMDWRLAICYCYYDSYLYSL